MSLTAKIQYGIGVVQLAHHVDAERNRHRMRRHDEDWVYADFIEDDSLTPVPEQAAFRVDWPLFLNTLNTRDRNIAAFLAVGHQATEAAREFDLSLGRISQVRKDWQRRWSEFHADCP